METTTPGNKKMIWAGRIISGLFILFMLFDAGLKIVKAAPAIEGSTLLGWPEDAVQGIGITLLYVRCSI